MSRCQIVVDLSDKTLMLFRDHRLYKSYRVGIGRVLSQTPTGWFTIVNKVKDPGGPYGAVWMGLSKQHFGIHGTNRPSSIGHKVSSGCIRMYNRDIVELAKLIPIGTSVNIRT